jgi:hypothetical protein
MPRVISYHPQVAVCGNDGVVYKLTADLPDWVSDEEFLRSVGGLYSCGTVGDLVDKVLAFKPLLPGLKLESLSAVELNDLSVVSAGQVID